ncbi:hypothetical protein ASC95_17265 [Pelomonas sp. Root1217]|uniref:hypothetical protein n=1 Tax=Pelomonas sp. Root1217 TaxID=1736430 RepID=UPI00070EF0AE|nr:hypothetical protein [Pelomonas sp. Root1217]KQV49353.1 hypothetical protein ASC95_17265 [Pelomonas sp. Root1217]
MPHYFTKSQIALAAVAALSSIVVIAPTVATAAGKTPGKYVSGDFHNHTTCSDGSISMQKLVKKVTDKSETPWGLDWFVQAGHGGNGNRNCTLVEDASLATPAYPYVAGKGPTTTWANSIGAANLKGNGGGVGGTGNMWRWQSLQEYQYPVIEYLAAQKNLPLFLGLESVVAGHEHSSMSVITGQMPASVDAVTLPTAPGYSPLGNANALAQWSYCFDRNDTDTSRGNVTGSTTGNNWNCANPNSADSTSAALGWSATGQKLIPATGAGVGTRGHLKTVEAMKWMANFHGNASYYVPAHLERAGPFNPNGNNGFNIEHLRNFNNAAPNVAFGFESQPGHGAADNRGEYQVKRNNIGGVLTDSVGGTTYGGTGVYAGQVGGVWDALLGEGRNWWFFASSDWHNRGQFGPDDRRSSQDFYPGEYQRTHVLVRNGADKLRPQTIVDGLRTGNAWAASGQLIDRLAFVACASYPGIGARTNASVEAIAVAAATNATDIDKAGCATMGEKLAVRPGAEIVVAVVLRDPDGANFAPYSFPNPSLLQVGINQPINKPVLDHVDVIRGLVTGYKTPGSADYAGEWPRNTDWLRADGSTAGLSAVPAAAKNTSAAILKTFSGNGGSAWTQVPSGVDNSVFLKMSLRIPAVQASQYVRLRGSNMPAAVPFETDANGNPLADVFTNANDTTMLRIPCTTVATNLPAAGATWTQANGTINGCPAHLATATGAGNPIAGQKAVSYDVAAWADLWFYSNPIYVEVANSVAVAGVK